MGPCSFEPESPYLTLRLPESNDILNQPEALRERLDEDGFLFLRERFLIRTCRCVSGASLRLANVPATFQVAGVARSGQPPS